MHWGELKFPWREKRYRRLVFTTGYGWKITPSGRLSLSLGRGRERIVLAVPEIIDRSGALVTPDRWGEIKLCWDAAARCWSLRIAYRVPDDSLPDVSGPEGVEAAGVRVVTIVRGRSYACVNTTCASVLHRDAVGGVNIHTLAVNDGTYVPVPPETVIRVKYLRAQPGWSADQRERHGFHQRARQRAGAGRSREARSSAQNRATRADLPVGACVAVVPCSGNTTGHEGGAAALRGVGRAVARTAAGCV